MNGIFEGTYFVENRITKGKTWAFRNELIYTTTKNQFKKINSCNSIEDNKMNSFDNVYDHIEKLASDYKCWDNRLTWEEALELNEMIDNLDRIKRLASLYETVDEHPSINITMWLLRRILRRDYQIIDELRK